MNKNANRTEKVVFSRRSAKHAPAGALTERGVALVITLLMLALVTVLSLGMVIAFSSQTLIGGYYRNYRGAFYAADSGLNIARNQVVAQLQAGVPATFTFPPIATSCTSSSAATVATTYANLTSLNTGTAAQSWHEAFKITNATISPVTVTQGVNTYSCVYPYSLTAVGTARAASSRPLPNRALLPWSSTDMSAATDVSFAYFGAFVDVYPLRHRAAGSRHHDRTDVYEQCLGIYGQPATWTSPYIFTDPVQQAWAQADYWDTGWGQHLSRQAVGDRARI